MTLTAIAKASPLHDFWLSEQTDEDEEKRLLKGNFDSKAIYLFEKEPYKWENLFQSISRQIINGDKDAIRGMKILLSTLSEKEKQKTINAFAQQRLFDEFTIQQLKTNELPMPSKEKNIFRFLKILFVIFTNPYGILLRRDKNHIYEKTGTFVFLMRNSIFRLLGNS